MSQEDFLVCFWKHILHALGMEEPYNSQPTLRKFGIMLGANSPFSLYFICFQIIVINYAKTMDLFVLCKLKTFNFVVNILMQINIVKKKLWRKQKIWPSTDRNGDVVGYTDTPKQIWASSLSVGPIKMVKIRHSRCPKWAGFACMMWSRQSISIKISGLFKKNI
jgi:hypothetical protein